MTPPPHRRQLEQADLELASITQIMRHYLALQPEMADTAIDKLNAWMQENEIAI